MMLAARAGAARRASFELTVERGDGTSRPMVPCGGPEIVVNAGFRERETVVFSGPPAHGLSLRVDDEPLPSGARPGRRTWSWTPLFYAGEVTAELVGDDGRVVAVYLLDVSPDPAKLGGEMFRAMVEEIRAEDPALLLGAEPATVSMAHGAQTEDPLAMYARLRRHGPALVQALRAIADRPLRALRDRRETVPLQRVRRIDATTVRRGLVQPALRSVLSTATCFRGESARGPQPDASRGPVTADVPSVEVHLDGAANRCIAHVTRAVHRRVVAVRESLKRLVESETQSEASSGLAARWPVRDRFLRDLQRDLDRALAASPLCDVRRPEIGPAGLNAISAHPLYARAYNRGWRILCAGLDGSATERLWMSPTWQIYERWCFVKLARMLREHEPALLWERVAAKGVVDRVAWIGRGGTGRQIRIGFQQGFPCGPPFETGRRSLSLSRVPDIVIEIADGDVSRFVVFDAKYSVTRGAVLEAMASAHLYHDALLIDGRRPDVALLLVPSAAAVPWITAPSFHAAYGVGVIALGPQCGDPGLLLRQLA